MRRNLGSVLLWGAILVAPRAAQCAPPQHPQDRLEVAVTYSPTRSNTTAANSFWLQGGSVEIHGQIWKGLGAVAEIGGSHTAGIHDSAVGLNLVTATFGPRYTWSPERGRVSIYGQVLAGEANGWNSLFPSHSGAQDSADSLAVQAGGGVNVALRPHLALRAFEASWMRIQLPNSTTNVQNNLKLGTGFVFRFK